MDFHFLNIDFFFCTILWWHEPFICPNPEERARIYSSDSDEGSDDDKAQRLMKAKKLDSDEVGALPLLDNRGQWETRTLKA